MFQKMANEGHYTRVGGTRQGIYVCSPSGRLLSSINSLNPDAVLESVMTGLDKWKSLPRSERYLPDGFTPSVSHRWENSYPENGLVLKGAKADLLSDPPRFSDRGDRWNMDHVWFNEDEAHLWLPKEHAIGENHQCPKIIKDRLFRFHLVDNVRGQTLPFAPEEIKVADLSTQITGLNGKEITIEISGRSKAIAKGPWLLGENDWTPSYELDHGMSTNLLGYASYNVELNKFTKFEMVSIGKRKGKTQNNGRKNSPDSGYIGFYFTLAKDMRSERIAPAFVDVYNADWIVQP